MGRSVGSPTRIVHNIVEAWGSSGAGLRAQPLVVDVTPLLHILTRDLLSCLCLSLRLCAPVLLAPQLRRRHWRAFVVVGKFVQRSRAERNCAVRLRRWRVPAAACSSHAISTHTHTERHRQTHTHTHTHTHRERERENEGERETCPEHAVAQHSDLPRLVIRAAPCHKLVPTRQPTRGPFT